MSPTASVPEAATELRAPARLTDLLARAQDARSRARRLTTLAAQACARAVSVSAESSLHRRERLAWARLLGGIPTTSDRRVTLCAYCHRARAGENEWIVLPAGIEAELLAWRSI